MEPSKLPPLDPSQIPLPTQSLQPESKKRAREEQREENLLPTNQSNSAPDSSQLEKIQETNLREQRMTKALRKETDLSISPQLPSVPKTPMGRGISQTFLLTQEEGLGRGRPPLPNYGQQSQGYQSYPSQGYQSYPPQGYPPQGFAESPSEPQTPIQPPPLQRIQQTPYRPQSQGHQPPIHSYSPPQRTFPQQKKLELSQEFQELSNTTTTSISPSVQEIYPQSHEASKNPTASLPKKSEITDNPQVPRGKPPPPKSTEWRFKVFSEPVQVDKAGLAHDLRTLDAPTALKNHMQHRLDNFQISCQHLLDKKDSTRNYRDIQMITPFNTQALHYFLPQDLAGPIPKGYERTHNSLFPAIRVIRSHKEEELNDKELYAILNAVDIAPGIVNRLDDEIEQGPVSPDILAHIQLSYVQVGSDVLTGREFARELLNQVYAGSLDLSVASHYLGQHIFATLENVAQGQFVTSRQTPLTSTEKDSMLTLAATYFV